MIAVMIRDYCGRVGVTIQEPHALVTKHQKSPRRNSK